MASTCLAGLPTDKPSSLAAIGRVFFEGSLRGGCFKGGVARLRLIPGSSKEDLDHLLDQSEDACLNAVVKQGCVSGMMVDGGPLVFQ